MLLLYVESLQSKRKVTIYMDLQSTDAVGFCPRLSRIQGIVNPVKLCHLICSHPCNKLACSRVSMLHSW